MSLFSKNKGARHEIFPRNLDMIWHASAWQASYLLAQDRYELKL